jgi:hypothetical protein
MDLEPIGEPQRPFYPGGLGTNNVVWIKAVAGDVLPDAVRTEPSLDSESSSDPELSPDPDLIDVVSDVGIELATDGRPYRQWWGETCC